MPRKPRPTPTPTPTPAPATGTVTVDVPTDGRDASPAFAAALARIPDGTATTPTVVAFPPAATIGYGATLRVDDRRHLTLDLNGATLRAVTPGDLTRIAICFASCVNVGARNGSVIGTLPPGNPAAGGMFDPAYEGQHGISFEGTNGGHVEALRVDGVRGDFLEARSDRRLAARNRQPSTNIEVRPGCDFRRAARQGFGLTSVIGFRFLPGSYAGDVGKTMFDLEVIEDGGVGFDLEIAGRYGTHRHAFFANTGGNPLTDCGRVTFRGVIQDGQPTTCQALFQIATPAGAPRRSGYLVEDSTFRALGALALASGVDGLILRRVSVARAGTSCQARPATEWVSSSGALIDCHLPASRTTAAVAADVASSVSESGTVLA